MPKPKWLEENRVKSRIEEQSNKCVDCLHFGRPVKKTRHRGRDRCMIHECDIHPGCMNTRFSMACSDWKPMLP